MKLEKIKPYEKNAKKHPQKQIEQIANSIKEFGFNQPIVVDEAGVIVVGHGRYYAAKHLELESVPVLTVKLSPEQVRAYRLADNKLNESEWDMQLVIEELKLLDPSMLDLTGFSRDLIIDQNEKDDAVPEVTTKPKAVRGGVYQLGDHRVMCGDSTDLADVEKLMNGAKADMVFTDPPYGVDYEGKTKDKLKIENDKTTEVFTKAIDNFITKVGASFYVCCPAGNKFKDFVEAFESRCHQSSTIIWVKNSLVLGPGDYHYQHEPILYGWNKDGTHKFYGDRTFTTIWKQEPSDAKLVKWIRDLMTTDFKNGSTIWRVDRPSRSAEHPTMKPVELITRAIFNSSKSEDIILDLFLGSGSTLIAAEKTKRICYGMELDPHYADVIIKRWEEYTGQKASKTQGT